MDGFVKTVNRAHVASIDAALETAHADTGYEDAASEAWGDTPHPSYPTQPEAVFQTIAIEAAYSERTVLKNISFHILDKSITAIMGPSGCGKSTLLRILNRTLELTPGARILSGKVLFRNQNIYSKGQDPRAIRKRIGLIYQRPVPFPMSILENVLFGVSFHGLPGDMPREEYARLYLKRVGLWEEVKDRLRESANKLSGGQQQRLCLARALANQPEVILMDEPCSSLDPAATRQIEELIAQLKRDYTIVVVTHNIAQARRISEFALFMFAGTLVESGPNEKIFHQPETPLARDFITGKIG